LLSAILKPLQRRNKATQLELSPEIKMSLSFITSGCLAVLIGEKTAFVFKGSETEIELLSDVEQILFEFECIQRSEFPSVRMYFELSNRENKPYQFDYCFGIESDEEIGLLSRLRGQDSFNIFFFDSGIRYSKTIDITQEGKKKIECVLDEAISRGDQPGRPY
jgi:hypothetical protein